MRRVKKGKKKQRATIVLSFTCKADCKRRLALLCESWRINRSAALVRTINEAFDKEYNVEGL